MVLANVRLPDDSVTAGEPAPVRTTDCGLLTALSVNVNVPAAVPRAVGENVTPTVQVAPAAILAPQLLLANEKAPPAAMFVKFRLTFSWFVSFTVAVLILPTATVPRFRLLDESVTGVMPVPVKLTVCGLFAALSVMVNAPVTAPRAVGEKVTPRVQVAPAPLLVPQVFVATENPALAAMLLIVRGIACLFVSVSVCAALLVPWAWFPNTKLVDDRVSTAIPVPSNSTAGEKLPDPRYTVRVDASFPTADGVNVTVMLQLCPAPSELGLSGQFPPQEKSPELRPLM